jgi:hypothetical protein
VGFGMLKRERINHRPERFRDEAWSDVFDYREIPQPEDAA